MARYIPQLDGLRAVAVLLVIGLHTLYIPGGYIGVDVFFVLSGYLITTILLQERDEHRWSLRQFYLRRARRLYPAVILMLVLLIPFGSLLVVWGGATRYLASAAIAATDTADFVTAHNVLWMGGIAHTWSLAVEEQFYLIWPLALLLLLRVGNGKRYALLGGLTLAAFVAPHFMGPSSMFLPLPRGSGLLCGCMLAFALRRGGPPKPALITVASAFLLAAAVVFAPSSTSPRAYMATVVVVLASSGLIAGLVRGGGLIGRLLSIRPLVWLGQRSYSIYLWHAPLSFMLYRHVLTGHRFGTLLGTLGGSLILAELSYRLVESRFRIRPHTERLDDFALNPIAVTAATP